MMAKKMIKCESCGRNYDYLESESCPHCGALNYDKTDDPHICDTDEIQDILEMTEDSHDDHPGEMGSRPPAKDMYSSEGGNVWERYAASKGRDTGSRADSGAFHQQSMPSYYEESTQAQKPRKGCTAKSLVIGLVLVTVVINIVSTLLGFLFDSVGSKEPESSYAWSGSDWEDWESSYESEWEYDNISNYIAAEFGQLYTVAGTSFLVDDVAIIDLAEQDADYAVVGLRIQAAAASELEDYSQMSISPYLVTLTEDATGQTYYYTEVDMLDYDLSDSIEAVFGDYYLDFLQNYEISYMNAGETSAGYIPFVVESGDLDDLGVELEVFYLDPATGRYLTDSYTYTIPELSRHITLEDVRSAYENTGGLFDFE